ncbi:MAG: helix-turn-helix transcriptional regulator [Cyanobacteria bacterium J06554_6]
MRPIYHPERDQITLAGVLYALGDPVRLEIVRRLADQGEQPCRDCGGAIAKSTLSHHFKILRESGVIQSQKVGTQHLNSLREADLEACFPGLLRTILSALPQTPAS